MKDNYDRHKKTSPDFKPGDLVLLNTKNMRTTRAMKKLENLRDGPFKVLKKVGASAYLLEIPNTWKKAGIHPTFNEKLVTPYHAPSFPSQQKPPPPPPVVVNEQEEYEVQRILDSRCDGERYIIWSNGRGTQTYIMNGSLPRTVTMPRMWWRTSTRNTPGSPNRALTTPGVSSP